MVKESKRLSNQKWYQEHKETYIKTASNNCGGPGVQSARRAAKAQCRADANYICQICGQEGLDAHHIIPVNKLTGEGDDSQENLICLCRSCHERTGGSLYVIDTNKHISINYDRLKPVDAPKPYVVDYMKLHNVQLYKSTNMGYFYVDGMCFRRVSVADMKRETGYKTKAQLDKEAKEPKRIKKADITYLKQLANYYKTENRYVEWHNTVALINRYTLEDHATVEQLRQTINMREFKEI